MSRITKDIEIALARRAAWVGWWPVVALPAVAYLCGANSPRWVLMWALAFSLWGACKWISWWDEGRTMNAGPFKKWAYLLGWPGMDAKEFLDDRIQVRRPAVGEWIFAAAKICLGVCLVWFGLRCVPEGHPLLLGWTGMIGFVFLLHFGLFHLLALFWQNLGMNAQPIMRAPILAHSVSNFWNKRWNAAFNHLVHLYVFRPLFRATNVDVACLAAFLVSGLIHDLVISIPAHGGYGLPTVYFLLQGCAVIFERSNLGRRLGLRGGWQGRTFMFAVTAGPVFWLFHPPFIHNVILPMLAAIGATKGNMKTIDLVLLLQLAGLLHLGLLAAGLTMPRAVNLRAHLTTLPPFIRRLFWVYYAFIGLCLVSFGVITFKFAGLLATGETLSRALCLFMAAFWTLRLVAATFIFDVRPYLTSAWLRIGYHATNIVFIFLPVVYAWAAFK